MAAPETRYAKLGEALIAYWTIGEGPIDVITVTGMLSNVETMKDYPPFMAYARRMAKYCRLIVFDRRGTGGSDPVALDALPTWEEWTDDVRAVLDTVGSDRACIFALLDAGPMGLVFASTHPDRTSHLLLYNVTARYLRAPDYQIGFDPEQAEALATAVEEGWGKDSLVAMGSPRQAHDPEFREWATRFMRLTQTPRATGAYLRHSLGLDARAVASSVQAPTLVMHAKNHVFVPPSHGRWLADHIPGARFVEVEGGDLYAFTDAVAADFVNDEVEEFLTGSRPPPESDRSLATVLFTDIVSSTDHVVASGDREWARLLDQHDALVARELERYRGRKVNPTGDGVLATFDGPARAVRCAQAICSTVRPLGIEIRAGLHTGEVELRGEDVGGIAVHIGQRVSALAGPGEVLVSRTVTDLVAGSGLEFEERGEHVLRGVPGKWPIYAVKQ